MIFFFFSSRRRHTRCGRDWSSDVCSSDLTWPGNVRELRNVLERSAIMCEKDLISRSCLPGEFGKSAPKGPSDLGGLKFPIGTTVEAMERELILQTLSATNNNKTRAAELLGISLKTLHNKL